MAGPSIRPMMLPSLQPSPASTWPRRIISLAISWACASLGIAVTVRRLSWTSIQGLHVRFLMVRLRWDMLRYSSVQCVMPHPILLQGSLADLHIVEIRLELTASIYSTLLGYLLGSPQPSAICISGVRVKLRNPLTTNEAAGPPPGGKPQAAIGAAADWRPPRLVPPVLMRYLPGLSVKVVQGLNVEVEGLGLLLVLPELELSCSLVSGPSGLVPEPAAGGSSSGLRVILALQPFSLALMKEGFGAAPLAPPLGRNPVSMQGPAADVELLCCHGLHLHLDLSCSRCATWALTWVCFQ